MTSSRIIGTTLVACFILGGCVSKQERVEQKEDLLAAAGFIEKPADTPAREADLAKLPPHHFIRQANGDKLVYLYADPLVCNCIYIGDAQAYGRYHQEIFQQNLAEQQSMAAEMNYDASWNWQWGPWGPGWWYPYPYY